VSFGNSKVFPFPAVQYIPMGISTVCQGPIHSNSPKATTPILITGMDIKNGANVLAQEYGVTLPEYLPDGGFPILALNLNIRDARYRGFTMTMTGRFAPGNYHYFTVPQRYFYKSKLFFEVYDQDAVTLLARYSFFMPQSNRLNNHPR
jgi:hypothetical protein